MDVEDFCVGVAAYLGLLRPAESALHHRTLASSFGCREFQHLRHCKLACADNQDVQISAAHIEEEQGEVIPMADRRERGNCCWGRLKQPFFDAGTRLCSLTPDRVF